MTICWSLEVHLQDIFILLSISLLLTNILYLMCRSCLFLKKYKDIEAVVKIEEVNGEELVKRFAEEMEEMLGRKMKSVKVCARC